VSVRLRQLGDRAFTGTSLLSVALIAAALVVILGPMLARGVTAVIFRGTVEFRKMQFDMHQRGDASAVQAEAAIAEEARKPVYDLFDDFAHGVDTELLEQEATQVYRDLGDELDRRKVSGAERREVRGLTRTLRDALVEAYQATDRATAEQHLARVLEHAGNERLTGTAATHLFAYARSYGEHLRTLDFARRAEYAAALAEVKEALRLLLGPRPGEPTPPLAMDRYGATRMDMAERALDDLLYAEKWVETDPGRPLAKQRVPRERRFAETSLAPLFPYVRAHLNEMLRPRLTFYGQYFWDDSIPGHYFGGVGPEILGTLSLTALAILLAFPVGLVSAAYLVEVAGDNAVVNFIRMCINTLAGVPSIVFGLFGLAFFVHYVTGKPCVLAAALTLAVLILPVIIRASEEAIRAVPTAYKEAALALGASRLRCFVTVQLPVALPGVLTGVILSMSRAAGETAPILFTGAIAFGPALNLLGWPPGGWLFSQTRALSYGGYDIAVGDRIAAMVPHQQYGMVTTLIGLVLVLNITAIVIRWRISRKLRG
jgi:phosphate transport system permease protein